MSLRFFIAIGVFFFWIIFWTLTFPYFENWTYIDSFYFAVTTLTTVWYWDITPITEWGRLFTAIYIIFWVTSVIWWSMVIIWWHTINKWEDKIKRTFYKTKDEVNTIIEEK
jgi:hypothetical protein